MIKKINIKKLYRKLKKLRLTKSKYDLPGKNSNILYITLDKKWFKGL